MRRIATVALIVVWASFFACAQRSASRGGPSFHAPPSSHQSFSRSAPGRNAPAATRFAGTPRFPGFSNGAHAYQRGDRDHRGGRHPDSDSRHRRMPYRGDDRRGYPYGYLGYSGLVSPFLLGYPGSYYNDYPDSSGNGDAGAPTDYGQAPPYDTSQGYNAPQADPERPMPPDPYSSSPYRYPPSQPFPAQAPFQAPFQAMEQPVTLVFKDGRPREQIRNYILTRTTLYIADQNHRQIPIDDFDLSATRKANLDAGVDFELPVASR